jgi:hypothetical protein
MFIKVVTACLLLTFFYLVVSQVILPAIFGNQLFPIFRKEKNIRDEITEVNQNLKEADLSHKLDSLKQQLENTHTPKEEDTHD